MDEIVKTDAEISKEAKKRKRKQAIEDVTVLIEAFPKCFNLKTPKPLKVGINQEIFEVWGENTPMTRTRLYRAIRWYAHSKAYLSSFDTEKHRLGLNEEMEQEITEEDRERARDLYSVIYKRPEPDIDGKKVKDISSGKGSSEET